MSCIITRFFHPCLSCTFNEEKFSLVKLWLIFYFPHHIALCTNWPLDCDLVLGPHNSQLLRGRCVPRKWGLLIPAIPDRSTLPSVLPLSSLVIGLMSCPKSKPTCAPVARVQAGLDGHLCFFSHYLWTVLELRGFLVTTIFSEITPYPFLKNGSSTYCGPDPLPGSSSAKVTHSGKGLERHPFVLIFCSLGSSCFYKQVFWIELCNAFTS